MRKEDLDREVEAAVESVGTLLADPYTVIWIGSGVSALAFGHDRKPCYPPWKELVTRLCEACGVEKQGSDSPDVNSDIADECKAKGEAYSRELARIFSRVPASMPRIATQIVQLQRRALITTNFDHVIELAARDSGVALGVQSYDGLRAGFGVPRPLLAYLHGRAPNTQDNPAARLVLSTSEFEEAYGDPEKSRYGNASLFLMQTLPTANVVFLGYSLSEPSVQRTLELLGTLRDALSSRTRWAMLVGRTPVLEEGDPEYEKARRQRSGEEEQIRRAESLGIEVVSYTVVSDDHRQLSLIVERLLQLAGAAREEQEHTALRMGAGADAYAG
jgi:hypothetical protein